LKTDNPATSNTLTHLTTYVGLVAWIEQSNVQ